MAAAALAHGLVCVLPLVLSSDHLSAATVASLVWLQIVVAAQSIFALRQRMWTVPMMVVHMFVVVVVAGVAIFLAHQFDFALGWSDNVQHASYVGDAPLGDLAFSPALLALLIGTRDSMRGSVRPASILVYIGHTSVNPDCVGHCIGPAAYKLVYIGHNYRP